VPELPVLSGDQVVRVLGILGYEVERTRGSHIRLRAPGRPPLTIPRHHELDRGTLRAIIRQARLTVEEFVALVD
jgi:predicted RNA binding protein YcfA (HicA-like mRNA interferase family)